MLLLISAIQLLIGGLLLLAGSGKLLSSAAERERWLRAYGLLPASVVPGAAVAIPSAELLAGATLVIGLGGQAGIGLGVGVLAVVTTAAAVALALGRRPECGCFGPWARTQLSWTIVGRNVVLIALLAGIAVSGVTQPAIATWPRAGEAAMVVVVAAVIVLLLPRRGTGAPAGKGAIR